jgi:formamidopyrimidine-DNA glycosylase
MPELPEVEHLRLSLIPRLVGHSVLAAQVHRREVVVVPGDPASGFSRARRGARPRRLGPNALLVGGTIASLQRTGKQLAVVAADGRAACIHLGMSGQLRWHGSAAYRRARHEHITWRLEEGSRLAFRDPPRFGGVWLFPSFEELQEARWAALGPDALSLTPEELAERIAGSRRAIKAALLDQGVAAGVGNIYADEALFQAGVSPLRPARRLSRSELEALAGAIRGVMRASIGSGGSTLRDYLDGEGRHGTNQLRFAVYGRAGQPCVSCGRPLRALKVAQRTTVMCRACQG